MVRKPVAVCVRTRPTANFSQDQILIDSDKGTIQINQRSAAEKQHMDNKRDSWNFQYNRVMHNVGQDTTYELVAEENVRGCVEGINATIMAYGQTGAGKTFTMTGDTSNYKNRGIIPRAIAQLFQDIADRPQQQYNVSCSYMEIYNEKIYDLLDEIAPGDKEYTITENPETHMIHVRGLTHERVDSEEGALNLLFRGEQNRIIAEHKLNKRSNRSHSIFTLHVEQKSKVRSEEVLRSKLNLVDLAGSERLKKAIEGSLKVDDKLRKESMYINKSLTYLEQVVVALTSRNRKHIPYRQTKLTNILKDSLGGSCNTALIACIWGEASHIDETISTLKLAQRMMKIENLTSINVSTDPSLQMKRYERIIRELKQELMMHDALANRSGMSYEEYTPEECTEIAKEVRKYVDAPPEEEESVQIQISSVRQIRECFRQFKILVQNVESEVEARLRQQFVLQAKESKESENDIAGNNKGEEGMEYNQMGEGIERDGFVGDEEDGSGYSLGIAPPSARPKIIERSLRGDDSNESLMQEGEEKDGHNENQKVISTEDNYPEFDLDSHEKVPKNRDQAFKIFTSKTLEGKEKYAQLSALTNDLRSYSAELQNIRSKLKQVHADLEDKQQLLISMHAEQKSGESKQYADDDVVDEEEFILLKTIKQRKQEFRSLRESFNVSKDTKKRKQHEQENVKAKLLASFRVWHQVNIHDEDEDVLDDGEQFEKLEIERVMSEDPESVAFFKASKASKTRQRKQGQVVSKR